MSTNSTLSQYLMSEVHDLHMAFQDNAFVKAIWECSISKPLYAEYHAHLYLIYSAMERLSQDGKFSSNPYFGQLYSTKFQSCLNRVDALERDLEYYYGPEWKSRISTSKATDAYIKLITDAASDSTGLRLLMHQFQRYLADLSGGQTLRVKLKKTFNLSDDRGVAFYVFDSVERVHGSNQDFVELYLRGLDRIGTQLSTDKWRELRHECMQIYEVNHMLYNEMMPHAPPTPLGYALNAPDAQKTQNAQNVQHGQKGIQLFEMSLDELRRCDGVVRKDLYVCVDGTIFDVSAGRDFYGPGRGYHLFAGRDATFCLATNSLKREDLDKFVVKNVDLTEAQRRILDKWKRFFEGKYKKVGYLKRKDQEETDKVPNRVIKLEELRKHDGKGPTGEIYICVDGVVFDVTKGKEYYGPQGGYKLFAGCDITYSLATASLKKEDVNRFEFELNAKQEKSLKKWKAFYMKTYTPVGKLNKFYWKKQPMQSKL